MLRDRKDLERELIKFITNKNTENKRDILKIRNSWYWELLNKYSIPLSLSRDIITLNKDLSEYNEFILFTITSVVREELIPKYFTEREIKAYAIEKYISKTIDFPIEFDMIKVDEDQFVGRTSVKTLMDLREAQLINYNADTQRALEVMVNNGKEIYRPYIYKKNVSEIQELFENHTFIPNTISLNINLDDEKADYIYDEKSKVLSINNISAFDIFDGYHRYLGMSRVYDSNPDFDYPMELRITMFSVSKAKQFIWQEDHKTKMKKIDSETLNQYNNGNIVVSRLNSNPSFYLCGKIALTGGEISSGILSKVINQLYFKNVHKLDRKEAIRVSNLLIEKFNNFMDEYNEYIDKKWNNYEISIILYGFYHNYSNHKISNALNKAQINSDIKHTLAGGIAPKWIEEVYDYE